MARPTRTERLLREFAEQHHLPLLVAQRQDSHVYVVVGEDVPRAEIAERLRAIAAGVPAEENPK